MGTVIEDLLERVGHYDGYGIDSGDRPFHAELALSALPGAVGVHFTWRTTGIDGTDYAEEHGWIAPDEAGVLALWCAGTSAPRVTKLPLRRSFPVEGTERTLTFAAGDHEVSLELWGDGHLGRSDGPEGTTSAVKMKPSRQVAPWEDDVPETAEV